jgi:hypothetical protein
MTQDNKVISIEKRPGFLGQLFIFLENLIRFVEETYPKLKGQQKFSWFMFYFSIGYHVADFYLNFPDRIDQIMEKLAGYVAQIVGELNDYGEFTHGQAVPV